VVWFLTEVCVCVGGGSPIYTVNWGHETLKGIFRCIDSLRNDQIKWWVQQSSTAIEMYIHFLSCLHARHLGDICKIQVIEMNQCWLALFEHCMSWIKAAKNNTRTCTHTHLHKHNKINQTQHLWLQPFSEPGAPRPPLPSWTAPPQLCVSDSPERFHLSTTPHTKNTNHCHLQTNTWTEVNH